MEQREDKRAAAVFAPREQSRGRCAGALLPARGGQGKGKR